jgi:hypothetical protein
VALAPLTLVGERRIATSVSTNILVTITVCSAALTGCLIAARQLFLALPVVALSWIGVLREWRAYRDTAPPERTRR